jgi:hypothetical protein
MFAGHVGAALAIGRAERRINIGVFVFAAMALDAVLWLLVLLGRESVLIPADFARTHQAQYVFPYSHGLLAGIAWSALAGIAVFASGRSLGAARGRAAALMAAVVFSHWLLDALVHAPELPLAGAASAKLGLGLWGRMPAALGVEAFIAAAGLWLYLRGSGWSRGRRLGLTLMLLVILTFTVMGMTVAPPPPSVTVMAVSSLVTIAVVTALASWIGRIRPAGR